MRGDFLYAQAIKDRFALPVCLPDEDERRECEFSNALCKIARRNAVLSFEVWEWSLMTFLPYAQYADESCAELTSAVLDQLYSFPKSYKTELVRYMKTHPDFMEMVVAEGVEPSDNLGSLIAAALHDGLAETAVALFQRGLKQADGKRERVAGLVSDTVYCCKDRNELKAAESFKRNILPIIRTMDIKLTRSELEEWERALDEHICWVENTSKKYAYTRKNAWRKTVPDGRAYDMDPCDYASAQEYLDALYEKKYGWRKWYKRGAALGVDADSFETEEEYREALDAFLREKGKREREERFRRQCEATRQGQEREYGQHTETEKLLEDDELYSICGVTFRYAAHPYYYRIDDAAIKIGDTVLVPVGDKTAAGRVVSLGQYLRAAAPFPVEQMKCVIRKTEEKG